MIRRQTSEYLLMVDRNPPIIQQLVSEITNRIFSGAYPIGARLPSESKLAEEFDVSRASIREAFADLDAKGLLWRKHGVGTFVMDRNAAVISHLPAFFSLQRYITQAGFQATYRSEPPYFRNISNEEVKTLVLPRESQVVVLATVHLADEVPVFIGQYTIPLAILNCEPARIDFSLDIPVLIKKYSQYPVNAIQTHVTPVLADAALAQRMQIPTGRPILLLRDIFYGQQGSPLFLNQMYFNNLKVDFSAFYTID